MIKKILIFLFFLAIVSPCYGDDEVSLDHFRELPILEEGRIKPLDSYARNVLLRFSGKRSFNGESAVAWLARHVFDPDSTLEDKIFLINHPDILTAVKVTKEKRRRYSFTQLEEGIPVIQELSEKAKTIEEKERSLVDNEILRLSENIQLYLGLRHSFQFAVPSESFRIIHENTIESIGLEREKNPYSFLDIALSIDKIEPLIEGHHEKPAESWAEDEKEALKLVANLYQWSLFYQSLPLTILPSFNPAEEVWLSPWDAISSQFTQPEIRKEIQNLRDLSLAYQNKDQASFGRASDHHLQSIQNRGGPQYQRASKFLKLEVFYNDLNAFFWSKLLYLVSLVLCLFYFLNGYKQLYQLTRLIIYSGFLLHFTGLTIRIILLSRPPVSNLYETFVFVSLIAVFLGVVLEFFHKKGIGFFTASVSGFLLLVIAGKYSAEGDTLKMLVAVLNTNFWLSIHVPTITMGYAAVCVAGVLGHIYLLQGWLRPSKKNLESTYQMILGILGLGLVLTFFGTCLGGIWADQSWGRFWGWDPKENGALMIVLWLLLILHSRVAGIVRALGVSVLSVLGLVVVMWAWFGVNLLSVGLHSYGFTSGIARNLGIYVLFEVLFLLIVTPLARSKQKH